jgi:hypothetical protein
MSDALCCIVPVVMLLLIPLPILWARKKWSMRGLESRFDMDGAACLEPTEGNVVVRRKKMRSIILLVVLALAGIGVLALAPMVFRNLLSDDIPWYQKLDQIWLLPVSLIIIWAAVFVLARSAFLPAITFDQRGRVVVIGRGKSERRIPFSDLSSVVVETVKDRAGGLEVNLIRQDGDRIKLGTLSGPGMYERAQGIAHLVERITGAQAQMLYQEMGEGEFIVPD